MTRVRRSFDSPARSLWLLVLFCVVLVVALAVTGHGGPAHDETTSGVEQVGR